MIARYFAVIVLSAAAIAQPLDPAKLLRFPTDAWPTYNGDYSGRRHSPLTQINTQNVNSLALAWATRANPAGGPPVNVQIKATPLQVNGVLYFTAPDHASAVDARSGKELWH